jgi:integrase
MTHRKLYLTKRSNQIWYIGWIEDGRRRWRTTKCSNKSDALCFLKAFEQSTNRPTANLLLSECHELFLVEHGPSLRKNTLDSYASAMKAFLRICGDKHLTSYTQASVEQFKQQRTSEGATPTTVNIYLRSMMAIFSFALKRGLIEKTIFHISQSIKVPKRPPAYLGRKEFDALIEQTPSPLLREIFTFAATTGMRAGEIVNLKWTNVDLERRQASIVNSEDFTTKSGKGRVVPLNETAFKVLVGREAQRRFSDFAFHKRGFRIERNYLSHAFKKAVRKAGLSESLRFHSLRHTFGSWCAQSNVPIYTIQALMGHSNVQTTSIYAHLAESHLHSAVEKIAL